MTYGFLVLFSIICVLLCVIAALYGMLTAQKQAVNVYRCIVAEMRKEIFDEKVHGKEAQGGKDCPTAYTPPTDGQ